MKDNIRILTYVWVAIMLVINTWMCCNNAHNIGKLQEQQVTDSVTRVHPHNINVTIKYVLPNDTCIASKSE